MSRSQRILHRHLRNSQFLKDQDQEERLAPLAEFGLTVESFISLCHKDRYRVLRRLREFGHNNLADTLKQITDERAKEN